LSVRREVREELEKLRSELKINDLSDLLILLVRTYREHTNIISKFEEILTNTISKFEELLTNTVSKAVKEALSTHTNTISMSQSAHTNSVSMPPSTHTNSVSTQSTTRSREKAINILRKRKVECISEIRGARSPEAVIESMKRGGAVVVRTDEDVCAVDPDFWELFKRRLNETRTPDDREVLSRLGDEKMKKLFQLLRKAGALYLDAKTREWVYDYSFIEEPGEKRREEEEVPVDWEYA
jgi:hypothetical protein